MPLARIILAGVNVLAAIAFLWLASADWGQRYLWSHGVWRYDVALNGLPLDENRQSDYGDPEVSNLTEGNLKQLFKRDAVKTQKEEVEKRYKQLRGEVDSAPEEIKQQRLVEVLRNLARTAAERDSYTDMKTEELSAALDNAFKGALRGMTSDDKALAADQWRREIAHVLFCVEDKPEEQDRLVTILGARSYASAADRQATALRGMEQTVQRGSESDRATFAQQYRQTVQRIMLFAERVADLKDTLQQHKELREKHENLVNARRTDVKQFEEKLAAATGELDKGLREQAELQNQLFATERALGEASEKNAELERTLRSKELGR